ncbi:hypothetical protein KKF34_05215 [Myxococcota bacterium]|nr:hypothetical protein [Myxococcota bacterium]MBU1381408.1 hypothetical protein [Myxococcota bacterium]MBU1496260.1 hypothetical protein [Myxococcota bacterium]
MFSFFSNLRGYVLLISLIFLAASCDDSSNDSITNNLNNNNANNTNTNNTNNSNNTNTNNTNNTNNIQPTEAVEIVVDIHSASLQKINIIEYTSDPNLEDCHFGIMRTGSGPTIVLCADTLVYNAGNSADFYEINEVPEEAIFSIDDGANYAIGTSWRDGGVGSTGFNMTENVYIFELPDGRYGKMEVLSSIGGVVTFLVFSDPDGEDDLTCIEPQ